MRQQGNLFEQHALPNTCQFSTINDVVIEDIDGDGIKDMVVAGKLYPMEIETARADASLGMFLKGNSDGEFVPVPPNKSGLYLPYAVKELAIIDTVNEKYLLVANSNGPLKVIKIGQGSLSKR